MRLQKWIALSGTASRREAEKLILEGKVTLNGDVIKKMGVLINPETDRIKVAGRLLKSAEEKIYIIFNKPRGCLTTHKDDKDRPTVMEYFKKLPVRVFPVGRLDYNTDGLLILTNDGDLGKTLLDPKTGVPRTYLAKVRGIPDEKSLNRLRRGVSLDGRPTMPIEVSLHRKTGNNAFLILTLTEGKNRHVRRVLEKIRHPVIKLTRTQFASLTIQGLPPSAWRVMTSKEIRSLKTFLKKRLTTS